MKKAVKFLSIITLMLILSNCTNELSPVYLYFNSNGGSDVESIMLDGESTTKMPDDPIKEGYTFDGWYYDIYNYREPFDESVIENDELSSDITLYAKWVPNKYELKFIDDDNSVLDVISVDYDTDLSSLSFPDDPIKEGYTFDGWAGMPYYMPAEDITVEATYKINSYDLIFVDYNDTEILRESKIFNEDLSEVDPYLKLTREGYTHVGWTNIPDFMPAADVVVKATYTINEYTITFDTNSDNKMDSIKINYEDEINFESNPIKIGYSFLGWFIDYNLTEPFNLTHMPAQNLYLYAKWSINEYTITFDTQNGSYVEPISGEHGTVINVPSSPTKEGYSFDGWY